MILLADFWIQEEKDSTDMVVLSLTIKDGKRITTNEYRFLNTKETMDFIWETMAGSGCPIKDIVLYMDEVGMVSLGMRDQLEKHCKDSRYTYDRETGRFLDTAIKKTTSGVPFTTATVSGYVQNNGVVNVNRLLANPVNVTTGMNMLHDLTTDLKSVLSFATKVCDLKEQGLFIAEDVS